ncbi:hypothetical protein GCM10008909_03560 [Hathewaya limosa]
MYYAQCLEKQKKTHDIQTYREIIAFTEGKNLIKLKRDVRLENDHIKKRS